jgi:hypothetical protein
MHQKCRIKPKGESIMVLKESLNSLIFPHGLYISCEARGEFRMCPHTRLWCGGNIMCYGAQSKE